jgi:hypothetical protein
MSRHRFLALSGMLAASIACSGPPTDGLIVVSAPSADNFAIVTETLDYSCGALDCHGSSTRNFRLYGHDGLRLAPSDVPCGAPTTAAEVQVDYRSAVALEPEVMAEVVASHGAEPDRLTLVRKARGSEAHKGGAVFPEGSDGDRCLVSWVQSAVDIASCDNSLPAVQCVGN